MRLNNLSIIQYQNISENPDIHRLWLPVTAFHKQIDYFDNNDFDVISLDRAMELMRKKASSNHFRPIALTFDNGFKDFYNLVFSCVVDKGFPCALFISPLKMGKSVKIGKDTVPYLSWSELRELSENNVTIGAFEDSKWNINNIDEDLIIRHIIEFKGELEDKLGISIEYFGIKEGVPNERVRNTLISEGYKAFFTQCPTFLGPDYYAIGRIQIDDNDFNIFLTKISKTYLFFKDRKSWVYIRKYGLDKLAHWISEKFDGKR